MIARRRLAGAALLAASLMLVFLASPVSAATPSAHGYWWRLQTGTGPPLPRPPVVPAGGMWVAANASGQQAVSALRYTARSGVEIRSLVLHVNQSSGQGAVVLACPAAGRWSPAEAGDWSARPATSCDIAFVKGVPSADATSWSFDVRGLARSGTLDVVLLPPPDLRMTFSIAFDPPGSSSIVTQNFGGSPSPTSSASAEESPHAGRVSPAPTRVLSDKTTPPGTSSSGPTTTEEPSSSFPPLASAPLTPADGSRPAWLVGLAGALAIAVVAAGVVLRRKPAIRSGDERT